MAKVTTPEVIGIASTLISVIVILSVIASIGIPSGLQRFIGRTYLHGKLADTRIYVSVSLILMVVGIIFSTLVISFAHQWILDTPVEPSLLFVSIILIWSTSLMSLFRSVIISSLSKSTLLPIVATFSTIVKIAVGISLVLVGLGALGVMIGFTLTPLIITIMLAYVSAKLLKSTSLIREVRLRDCFKDLISASFPSWVPLIINTIGSHLGTIVVYGAHGAEQAGVYYISLSIVIALITVMSALYTVSYPVLSAMKDGRKRLAWRSIKMTLVLSSPISLAFLLYSHEIISIFGQDYERGAGTLQILLLSIFPSLVTMGVSALVYANGKYRDVLVLGLASNVPRPLLYILLVPIFDTMGAALSYTIGSIIGLLFSFEISRKNGLKLILERNNNYVTNTRTIGGRFQIDKH